MTGAKTHTKLGKLINEFDLDSLIFRRAIRSALVVCLSVVIYHVFHLTQGYWVTLTTLIVMQATLGATLRKGVQRFLGTLLGVAIASIILLTIHNRIVIDFLVIVFIFFAYYFNPFNNLVNYGLVVVPLSISVVLMIALITPDKINAQIVFARFYDTVIGAVLGILGAVLIFPSKVKHQFELSKQNLDNQLMIYYKLIIDMLLNSPQASEKARRKKIFIESMILSDRQYYLDRKYEIHFQLESQKYQKEKLFIEKSERIAQQLFSLHQIARQCHLREELIVFKQLIYHLKNIDKDWLNLEKPLATLKEKLAQTAKKGDNSEKYFREIVGMASLHFTLLNLLNTVKQLKKVE